jgi:hypothetical protein
MFYFTDEKYKDLLKGNEPLCVERIFVILSSEPNTQKKHLANMLLCEWQADLKMKNPDPDTKCLDVDDLETRLTDLQQDYEFNHKQGTWYRHGLNSTRRFY